ncbi:MAG: class I SAM-dependent methyltransferase [Nitrospiraceae bacterium]|nr:class I SAM-dependent methyltransferase [Nitrospiraceae bacterium]
MYNGKPEGYFRNCRQSLIDLIPGKGGGRILEIGAGCGNTLIEAKKRGIGRIIVGIDLVPVENSNQSHHEMDRFIIGDIEEMELDFEDGYFDVIICGDVLEHLVDPWRTVGRLARYLEKGGHFIASIPNLREINTLASIIFKGEFRYAESGIMDKAHLRFFCRRNIMEMFEQNGLKVISLSSNFDIEKSGRKLLSNLTFGLFYDFFASQYNVVAQR